MDELIEFKLKKAIGTAIYKSARKKYDKMVGPAREHWRGPGEKFSKSRIKQMAKEGNKEGARARASLSGAAYNIDKIGGVAAALSGSRDKMVSIRSKMRFGKKLAKG